MNDKKEIGEDGVSVQEAEGFDLDEQAKSTRKQFILHFTWPLTPELVSETVLIHNDKQKYQAYL